MLSNAKSTWFLITLTQYKKVRRLSGRYAVSFPSEKDVAAAPGRGQIQASIIQINLINLMPLN